jgi:hypothetical protein
MNIRLLIIKFCLLLWSQCSCEQYCYHHVEQENSALWVLISVSVYARLVISRVMCGHNGTVMIPTLYSSSNAGHFSSGQRARCEHCVGGRVVLRAGLNAVAYRKIPSLPRVVMRPNTSSYFIYKSLPNNLWLCVWFHEPSKVIFIIILSVVRLSPLGIAATTSLLYQSQMINDGDCGAIGGMKIGRENRSTRRKPTPVPLCSPQIPHDVIRARTQAAAVGNQRLSA